MRKILITIISLLYSIYGIGQQISLNDAVTLTLPTGALNLSKDQAIAFADKLGYERRALPPNPQNVYKVDNMLLELYGLKGDFKDNSLAQQKTSMNTLFKKHSNYHSEIKTFNNCEVQISEAISNGKVIYYFSAINSAKDFKLNGMLQSVFADENEAKTDLNNLLNSIKFK